MVILDASAGNRMMWPNKTPPHVVFMDKQTRLARPPDVFGDYRAIPFRDDVFVSVFLDPPHCAKGPNTGKYSSPENPSYYGLDITKLELLTGLARASREIMRVGKRLILKWSYNPNMHGFIMTLWKVLPFFREWKKNNEVEKKHRTTTTWWVTFDRPRAR